MLVGEAGEIYTPAPGGWARDAPGSIAEDVAGAVRAGDGTIVLIAGRAPLYVRDGRAWRAVALEARGVARASTDTGLPIVAIGRTLYAFDGGAFRRIGRAPAGVAALWAGSSAAVWLVDDAGAIERGDGRRWTPVPGGFTPPETVARLVGWPGKPPYAIGDAGTILALHADGARPIARPDALAQFEADAADATPRGTIVVAGRLPGGGALAVVEAGSLRRVADLPPLVDGDRWSVVRASPDGGVLAVSYRGVVRLRGAGGAWQPRQIRTAAAEPVRAGPGPARTR